jgi:hypothetical protein
MSKRLSKFSPKPTMIQRIAIVIEANRNAPADEIAGMVLTEMREPMLIRMSPND